LTLQEQPHNIFPKTFKTRLLSMSIYLTEFIGTAILITLGNGVVANVVLDKTKGYSSGWIVITFGWAIAVFVAVFTATKLGGGAHLNPAITIAFAAAGKTAWEQLPAYIGGQITGAAFGSLLVYISYYEHYKVTENLDLKMATFCTSPAIRNYPMNFLSEMIGTFILVIAAFYMAAPQSSLGALDALPAGLVVLSIGLSLGGTTGYAINPARDLGPRILHAILPMKKRDSDWAYSWVPIAGPIAGALLATLIFLYL
jgi:glycerol uptake facilitator protein